MRASTYPLMDPVVAHRLVLDRVATLPVEEVGVGDAAGRVLAADLSALEDLPAWPASAVDGYAVRSADGGGPLRVVGESAAGHPFEGRLRAGTAVRILTGGVLPGGADRVVMVEDIELAGDFLTVPTGPPGSNFHAPGADARAGETVLRAGVALGPADVGLAATLGHATLRVRRRPRVAVLSTGDELVEVGESRRPGQIVDSNRFALQAALLEAGAEVHVLGIAPDEPGRLRAAVVAALAGADALVTSGGVSVGTHDLVKPLLESMGEVLVGRVKLRPGKPFTFAALADGKLAFGLPGFPVSSLITFEVFVRPALRKMQGFSRIERPTLPVRLGYAARAAGDRTEYQRVSLTREGAELVAHTTGSQSSSRLLSLAGANALVRVPPGSSGITAGTTVEAIILDLP